MEWVFASVEVVEDNVNDLVLLENERVGVAAIDFNVVGSGTGSEGRVEGRHERLHVGHVVDEGAGILNRMTGCTG